MNQKAVDEPEMVNDDPYGEGWLVRIRMSDPAEVDALHGRRGVPRARRRAMSVARPRLAPWPRDGQWATCR